MDYIDPEKSYGKFGARAFSANAAFPIEGALITVRKKTDGVPVTVAVLRTDESGMTPLITLETPPKSFSLTPQEDGVPYALYDVEASHENYYTVVARDIQIYADTTSILPINMIPLPDTSGTEKYPAPDAVLRGGAEGPNL